ncbi:MAG TPA: hypothetical protein VHS80_10285 [Chthoniobacterales bacterium]|nr:hypothetical protein [Chthoniobacterales bacterium]
MQTLAFLWFELQIAQYRLRETFTESPAPSKALHPNALPRKTQSQSGRLVSSPFYTTAKANRIPEHLGQDRFKITREIPRDDFSSRYRNQYGRRHC